MRIQPANTPETKDSDSKGTRNTRTQDILGIDTATWYRTAVENKEQTSVLLTLRLYVLTAPSDGLKSEVNGKTIDRVQYALGDEKGTIIESTTLSNEMVKMVPELAKRKSATALCRANPRVSEAWAKKQKAEKDSKAALALANFDSLVKKGKSVAFATEYAQTIDPDFKAPKDAPAVTPEK